jgi:hypothetical protein
MELNFALLAVSLRLPVGCQDLNLWQPDGPIFSTVISRETVISRIATEHSIATTLSQSGYNPNKTPKQHRRKRLC